MNLHYPAALLSAAALLCGGAGLALAQQPLNDNYLSVISVKVPPDKEAAFIEHYKTGAGAKAIQGRMKANEKARRWTLLRAVYPGDPAPEANFLIGTSMSGAPSEPNPARQDELTRASAGMSQTEYMQKVRSMSTQVGQTLSHLHEATPGYSLAEGDYVVVRRLKIAEGKTQEVSDMMRDVQLAMTSERVKAGNLKGWSFSHLVFPTGNSLPFDAVTVFLYKDMASVVAGAGPGNGAVTTFTKLFPNKSYAAYTDNLRANTKVVRSDLFRVVATYSK
jgi:hypothetical protein